jgi:hypothetical protein
MRSQLNKSNKIRLAVLFFACYIGVMECQAQEFSISGDRLTIHNTSGNTLKVILKNVRKGTIKESAYILPDGNSTFILKNNRRSVRRHRIYCVYDEMCYYYDLELIKQELERLKEQRNSAIWGEAILGAFDQFFLKGRIGRTLAVLSLFSDVTEDNYDDFVYKFEQTILESKVIDALDGRIAKGLASASFTLLKLGREERFPEIENKVSSNINKLRNSVPVEFNLDKTLPKYIRKELKVKISYPVSQSYKFDGVKDVPEEYNEHAFPYNIRLTNSWNNDFSGIFMSAAYGQSPFFVDRALSYNTIDVGVGLRAGSKSYSFIEMGVRNFFANTYSYTGDDEIITQFSKDNSFEYYKSKLYVNVGLSISLKIFNIFGYYSFSGKKNDLWTSQFQAGLSIPLVRIYRYY